MRFCPECGLLLPADAAVCPHCGHAVPPPPPPPRAEAPRYADAAPAADGALSTGGYFASLLLFMIPIVGLVLALVWALGGTTNAARQRLARAQLLVLVVRAALSVLLAVAAVWLLWRTGWLRIY